MAARAAAATVVHAAIVACLAAFAAWLVIAPTSLSRTAKIREGLALYSLNGSATLALLLTWSPLLAATLLTLVLRRALGPHPSGPHARLPTTSFKVQVHGATDAIHAFAHIQRWPTPPAAAVAFPPQMKRFLARQLPPRALLAWWCGGLSVGEALGVLTWLALNAWWLCQLLRRSLHGGMGWTERLDK